MGNIQYKKLTAFNLKEIKSGEWELTEYIGFDEENIEIPAKIEEKKIVSIGNGIFKNNNYIKHLKIAEGIECIGDEAFLLCCSLKSVAFPNTLKSIGKYAFKGTVITELRIPSSVTKLGVGFCAFCVNYEADEENAGLMQVSLPEGLTEIPDEAFSECILLKNINLPKTVKRIGKRAFQRCEQLPPFVFHEGLEFIGTEAFRSAINPRDDEGWESVSFPKSLKKIEKNAFYGCEIKSIAFAKGCEAKLCDGAFGGNYLKKIYIPASITQIGEIFKGTHYGKYQTDKLDKNGNEVYDAWGKNVKEEVSYKREEDQFSKDATMFCEIGSVALSFAKSKGIKCADYESNLHEFFESYEQSQKNKQKREFEKAVEQKEKQKRQEEMAQKAAQYSQKLEKKQMAERAYEERKKAFSSEDSLGAEDIGTGLTSIVIPRHIRVIKEEAFKNNRTIKKISFESNSQLIQIDKNAMSGLFELSQIQIPASVRYIEDNAFLASKYLKSVTFERGSQLERIGENAFSMIGGLGCAPITLPMSVKYIGRNAFTNGGVKKITIPEGCQVEDGAFDKETKIIWVKSDKGSN